MKLLWIQHVLEKESVAKKPSSSSIKLKTAAAAAAAATTEAAATTTEPLRRQRTTEGILNGTKDLEWKPGGHKHMNLNESTCPDKVQPRLTLEYIPQTEEEFYALGDISSLC